MRRTRGICRRSADCWEAPRNSRWWSHRDSAPVLESRLLEELTQPRDAGIFEKLGEIEFLAELLGDGGQHLDHLHGAAPGIEKVVVSGEVRAAELGAPELKQPGS